METLIIPGFHIKNKVWAEEAKSQLVGIIPAAVHYWEHWNTEIVKPGWIEKEVVSIINEIKEPQVNILAKSIGTLVVMHLLNLKPGKINKIILCGIPVYDIDEKSKEFYKVLSKFPVDKVMVIQNQNDNHGNLTDVRLLLSKINPAIKIISKPRFDHEYPYFEDFIKFLK